jgi:hypothetical protein
VGDRRRPQRRRRRGRVSSLQALGSFFHFPKFPLANKFSAQRDRSRRPRIQTVGARQISRGSALNRERAEETKWHQRSKERQREGTSRRLHQQPSGNERSVICRNPRGPRWENRAPKSLGERGSEANRR